MPYQTFGPIQMAILNTLADGDQQDLADLGIPSGVFIRNMWQLCARGIVNIVDTRYIITPLGWEQLGKPGVGQEIDPRDILNE